MLKAALDFDAIAGLADAVVEDKGEIAVTEDHGKLVEVLGMVIVQLASEKLETGDGKQIEKEYQAQVLRALSFLDTGTDPLPEDHPGYPFSWKGA